jgi:hypothetical protein
VLISTSDHFPWSWWERFVGRFGTFSVVELHLLQVLRQGSFVGKMHDLGWTSRSHFEKHEDAIALHHAVVRYHA